MVPTLDPGFVKTVPASAFDSSIVRRVVHPGDVVAHISDGSVLSMVTSTSAPFALTIE
jgi:hypothetical protein